ncbi:MAG: cupin domain-containing protein [Fidelibacterota bacterium]|nr:MAG: cupin domain-containing protein [Candidatus Neomarinimicrobiota bacterium]
MIIRRLEDSRVVDFAGTEGITKHIVIGPDDGSNEMVLRHFDLEPGAASPYHQHGYPHLGLVLSGIGALIDADKNSHPLSAGDYIYVNDDEMHQFKNTSNEEFKFICIVPSRGEEPAAGIK